MAFTLNLIRPGDGMPERRRLEDGAYFIGRGASCAICLPFPEISERHAFVTLSGAQATKCMPIFAQPTMRELAML